MPRTRLETVVIVARSLSSPPRAGRSLLGWSDDGRQRLEAAASAGRFSNAIQFHYILWYEKYEGVAAATDWAIELELDPTPCTAVVDVKASVSVCEL
jgi:hypothetical protein